MLLYSQSGPGEILMTLVYLDFNLKCDIEC